MIFETKILARQDEKDEGDGERGRGGFLCRCRRGGSSSGDSGDGRCCHEAMDMHAREDGRALGCARARASGGGAKDGVEWQRRGRRSARRKARSASRTRLGKSSGSERAGVCTLIVLGSGGHTAEMLKLIEGLDPARYSPMHVVVAESDKRSAEKAISWAGERKLVIHKVTRSREVGRGWVSTVLTTIQSFYNCFVIMIRAKPQVVITNGPGTCLPIVYSAFFLRLLGTGHSRLIIFVESFARVKTLSLTGKLVFPIVDHFIVQWETLAQLYPRTRYLGPLF